MNIENTAHFVMQSKGGAGKSVVSVMLAQYLKAFNKDLILIDTDPSNKTLGEYKQLDVKKIEVLNKHKLVDQGKFDGFMSEFIEGNKPMLVDTGSGDFLAINGYMIQNEIPAVFNELGKKLIIHVPLNFNQAKADTMKCLVGLLSNHPSTTVVIWENEFFGENTENLQNTPLMKKFKNIGGVVKIREMQSDTDQKNFSLMLENSMTFEEVDKSDKELFDLIKKMRIRRIQNDIWEQLDNLFDNLSETNAISETE